MNNLTHSERSSAMNLPRQNFDAYVFSKQLGYHEPTVRMNMRILLLIMHIIMQKLTLTYKGLRSRVEAMFMNIKNSRELRWLKNE